MNAFSCYFEWKWKRKWEIPLLCFEKSQIPECKECVWFHIHFKFKHSLWFCQQKTFFVACKTAFASSASIQFFFIFFFFVVVSLRDLVSVSFFIFKTISVYVDFAQSLFNLNLCVVNMDICRRTQKSNRIISAAISESGRD